MLRVKRVCEDAVLPCRATPGSAGFDLASIEDTVVPAHNSTAVVVKTGLALELPLETYGRIAPRSGLAVKNGILVGAGVIDSDYRGEIGVVLFNVSDTDFVIAKGDRVAQLIVEKLMACQILEEQLTDLTETQRGEGGYGSTGK